MSVKNGQTVLYIGHMGIIGPTDQIGCYVCANWILVAISLLMSSMSDKSQSSSRQSIVMRDTATSHFFWFEKRLNSNFEFKLPRSILDNKARTNKAVIAPAINEPTDSRNEICTSKGNDIAVWGSRVNVRK